MPGNPKKRASLAKLRQMSAAQFEEILMDYVQGAKPLQGVLDERGIVMLGWRTHLKEHPECKAAWEEAKRYRAESLAEASLGIADGANTANTADVRKAQLQVAVRHWLASRYDPERFGTKGQTTVSIGQLHLTAVREINAEDTARRKLAMEASRRAEARIEEVAVDALDQGELQ
jgi:hypothetical protein